MSSHATHRRSLLRHSRLVNYTRIARTKGVRLRRATDAVRQRPRPMKSGLLVRRFLEIDRRQP